MTQVRLSLTRRQKCEATSKNWIRYKSEILPCWWHHVSQYNLSHVTWNGDEHCQVIPIALGDVTNTKCSVSISNISFYTTRLFTGCAMALFPLSRDVFVANFFSEAWWTIACQHGRSKMKLLYIQFLWLALMSSATQQLSVQQASGNVMLFHADDVASLYRWRGQFIQMT